MLTFHGSTVFFWDTVTGKQIGPPIQHLCQVHQVEVSPDGQRVITASEDGTLASFKCLAIRKYRSLC